MSAIGDVDEANSAIGVAIACAAVALWWLMPGGNSLAVDAQGIRTGAVVREAFRDFVPLRAEVAPLRTVYVAAVQGGSVA
ncbi:hypothetical protein, partial [Clostridium perfringens]